MTDFEKIIDFDNLYKSYRKAKSGKGYKNSSARFEIQALSGLHELKRQLETKQYNISKNIKYYGRYMDDLYLIHHDKDYLKYCLQEINKIVDSLKLSLNGKTQIMPFKQGIKFLGFHTYINDGQIVCKIRHENKRNAYRKYNKMARLVVDGKLDRKKFDECYQSWKAHANFGDCQGIIDNLDIQINQILGD